MKTFLIRILVIAASILAVLLFFVNVTLVFHICPIPRHICDAYLNKFNNLSLLAIIALLYALLLLENSFSADRSLKNKKRNLALYYMGLTGICAAGLVVRFVMVLLPSEFRDGHIITALNYLAHGTLIYPDQRTIGYPLYLTLILGLFRDFRAVIIFSHILGVVSGLVLLSIWQRMGKLIESPQLRTAHYLSGLILLLVALLNSRRIYHENMMEVEALSPLLFLVASALIALIIIDDRYTLLPVFIFFTLVLMNFQIKWLIVGALSIVICVVYVNIRLKAVHIIKRNLLYILLPFFVYGAVVTLPVRLLFTNRSTVSSFAASNLFMTHLRIIKKTMQRDIADPNFTAYDKELLKYICATYDNVHQEYLASVGNPGLIGYTDKCKNIGFKFNDLFWFSDFIATVEASLGNDPGVYKKFCIYYFVRSFFMYPLDYAAKVITELSTVYSPYRQYVFKQNSDNNYVRSFHNAYNLAGLPEGADYYQSEPLVRFLAQVKTILEHPELINEKPVTGINVLYLLLEKMYSVLVAVSLVLSIYLILAYRRAKTTLSLCKHAWITLIFHLIPFFMCLLTSSVYVLGNVRYIDELFFSLLLSEFAALSLITAYLYDRFKSRYATKI